MNYFYNGKIESKYFPNLYFGSVEVEAFSAEQLNNGLLLKFIARSGYLMLVLVFLATGAPTPLCWSSSRGWKAGRVMVTRLQQNQLSEDLLFIANLQNFFMLLHIHRLCFPTKRSSLKGKKMLIFLFIYFQYVNE